MRTSLVQLKTKWQQDENKPHFTASKNVLIGTLKNVLFIQTANISDPSIAPPIFTTTSLQPTQIETPP